MPHSVRGLGVMGLNWPAEFKAGRGKEGKWGWWRRTSVETQGGGRDRNSLCIKKEKRIGEGWRRRVLDSENGGG